MGRELRRVLVVIIASAAGFAILVALRVLAGEPAFQPADVWVVLIWIVAAVFLIVIALATGRTGPPRGGGPRPMGRR